MVQDETNSPNTRTAFSDMVSTAANRAKFISALLRFMKTYGFDGADLDWEVNGVQSSPTYLVGNIDESSE